MAELKTRISLKYDTLEHWQKSTLGLNKGELAIVEIPTADPENKQLPPVMFKVGVDGKKTFSELNWASALAADVYGWAKQSGITVGTSGTGNVVTGLSWDSANDRLLITKGDYVPSTRKVNNKALSADITLGAADVGVTETAFPGLNKVGTVTGVKMNDAAQTVGADGVVDLGTVITSHQDISGKQDKIKAGTHITIGTDGVTVNAAWPTDSDAGYAGINKTGTITGITMNGASKGTSGVVNLGTVLTEHQTIAEGATNGTISVAGTDVKVHGLGTAAYKAEGAFDAAGSATTAANGVLGHSTDDATANTVYGAKAAAKAAQNTIDNYKTSNDAALAGVKATAEAAQTSAQVDAKISAHNTSTEAHADIRGEITALSEKVSGRATNYVYKNDKDADYIAAVGKAGSFIVGDTIYFTDTNISDQWVIKVNATAPYYEFQDIETEKPSFDGYVKGTGLTADKLVLGNTGSNVKASTYGVSGTLTADDEANLPTSKAVATYVGGQLGNLKADEVTATAAQTISSIKQVNGKITIGAAQDIQIAQSQVTDLGTALGGKQDTLTPEQLAAVDSGITTAKVGQYDGYATGKQDKIDAAHPLSADLVDGLGDAAKKGVDTAVSATSENLPTSKAVASYVGGEIGKIVIPTVNNAALKDASDAIIFTANASADVKITVIDCGNASGWDA